MPLISSFFFLTLCVYSNFLLHVMLELGKNLNLILLLHPFETSKSKSIARFSFKNTCIKLPTNLLAKKILSTLYNNIL